MTPVLDTIAFNDELDRTLVTEAMAEQLVDSYGSGALLTVELVGPLKNGGTMVELVAEKLVAGYKGLQIIVCLFDKDGNLNATIAETL